MEGLESGQEKAVYVKRMFSSIAKRYDLLNTLLSFNQDKSWRRFTTAKSGLKEGDKAVDVATGTGELALDLTKLVGEKGRVVGVDFSYEMLKIAKEKVEGARKGKNIDLILNSAEALPFPDNTFDCATIGFTLRNVTDIKDVLKEMRRVVKAGGRVISLEFSKPSSSIFRRIYYLYFYKILPIIGGIVSGNREAYRHLPHSLINFPSQNELKKIMEDVRLKDVEYHGLTGGIATVHVGIK